MKDNHETDFVDEEQQSVNKTLAGEKKKLAQMSFIEKVEYIWSYYKLHIFAVVVALVFIVSLAKHFITYKDPTLCGVLINTYNYSTTAEQVINEKLHENGVLGKREAAVIYADANSEANLTMGEYFSKLDVYTAAHTIDYMLGDQAAVDYICNNMGTTFDVRDYMSDDLMALWGDRIIEVDTIDPDDTSEVPRHITVAGVIDITGTKTQELFGADEDVCYLMVADISGHTEQVKAFFDMLYEMEKDL